MLYDKSHDQVWVLTWGDMDRTHPTLQVSTQCMCMCLSFLVFSTRTIQITDLKAAVDRYIATRDNWYWTECLFVTVKVTLLYFGLEFCVSVSIQC